MNPEIQKRFEAVERQRAAMQSGVLALSGAQLDWTPRAESWSVRQIVEHLVLSDETVGRAQAAGRVEAEAWMFRVLPRAWRRSLILTALRRDAVLPLPSPDVEPRGDVALADLLSRWDAARGEMGRALDEMGANERRYSHPVLGPLTGGQMLELGETHTAYHARQMAALQCDPMFPACASDD